ncbi:MAG: CRISPR-associated endonuclease Cas2 [Anaerolineae bacterium]|nr:CRISPR-associated endonuclease Cas2 [Anaerolineae bacterium]
MFVVISYDIPDDRRRTRVANTLLDYGTRVQYSVFEVNLRPQQFRELREELEKLVKPEEDSLRFYHLCAECLRRVEIVGEGRVEEGEPLVIIV